MPGSDALLRRLTQTPRENGSDALGETATFLADALRSAGLEVELWSFTAHPYGARLLGVVVLLAGLLHAWAVWGGRWRLATAIGVVLVASVIVHVQLGVPVFGFVGATQESNVVATLPVDGATQRLILSAHYDTKTDLLDHVERGPIFMLVVPAALLLLLGPMAARADRLRHRPRLRTWLRRLTLGVGLGYCPAMFLATTAGALVPGRSPGALDDGAACAVLVELGRALARDPPARTEIQIVLFAAEELGTEGSDAWVEARYAGGVDMPTLAINLDPIGGSSDLAIIRREKAGLTSHPASPEVVALLRSVHDGELPVTLLGGTTDGVSFLRHGVPAATLIATVRPWYVPRGLHSSADTADRIASGALRSTTTLLLAAVRELDAREP